MQGRDGRSLGRRHLLAGLAGAGLVGAAVVGGDALGSETTAGRDRLPIEVTTLDAVGSTAGTRRVPSAETPTVIDCFATWCGPCAEQMASLGTIHDRYGDSVSVVSVIVVLVTQLISDIGYVYLNPRIRIS